MRNGLYGDLCFERPHIYIQTSDNRGSKREKEEEEEEKR